MPARIDPQERRQEVIRAAFRLVVAEGIEGVSLRKVADESGLNVGSVRHYFDGHHDLLTLRRRRRAPDGSSSRFPSGRRTARAHG